jgi:hypothetical protein
VILLRGFEKLSRRVGFAKLIYAALLTTNRYEIRRPKSAMEMN